MEQDLQTMLRTNGALTAIPMHYATDASSVNPPKITIQKIGETRETSNDGDVGSAVVNIQLNAIAPSLNTAKTLAKAVKSTLAAGMGTTVGATRFGAIIVEAERDIQIAATSGSEKAMQAVAMSVRFAIYDPL